jgi:hypothetical protein
VFGFTRLMVAAFGLGAGEEALQRAIDYGHERVQFGEALYRKQGFTHRLIVPHVVRLEAARAYCEEVARRLDAGGGGLQVEGSIAKYFATEAGNAAADAAIQAHGGYGYTHEYEVEKIRRDVRITTISRGHLEILQNIIGTHRWRIAVKTRGGFYREMAALRARQRRGDGARRRRPRRDDTGLPRSGSRASSTCSWSSPAWPPRWRRQWRSPTRWQPGPADPTCCRLVPDSTAAPLRGTW